MSNEGYSDDSGWVAFAATLFFVLGALNVIFGIAMLANSDWVVFTASGAWLLDLTGWGWVTLILGAIQLLVGWGVMSRATWARITGVIIAAFGALDALFVTPIYPIWGLAAFSLGVLVIYALTAHAGKTYAT